MLHVSEGVHKQYADEVRAVEMFNDTHEEADVSQIEYQSDGTAAHFKQN